jgi:hypothetical protein
MAEENVIFLFPAWPTAENVVVEAWFPKSNRQGAQWGVVMNVLKYPVPPWQKQWVGRAGGRAGLPVGAGLWCDSGFVSV